MANTTLLIKQFTKSFATQPHLALMPVKKPSSMPFQSTPTIAPPQIPTATKISESNGILINPAQNVAQPHVQRGSTAIISKLDICSVALLNLFLRSVQSLHVQQIIVPSPQGPNSRNKESATIIPRLASALNVVSTR